MNPQPVTLEALLERPQRVRWSRTRAFMVSAVRVEGGVIGVATYEIGAPRPAASHHYMVPAHMREVWLSRLRFA